MKDRHYADDDGRTIVDMSGIERRPLLIPKLRRGEDSDIVREPEEEQEEEKPWEAEQGKLSKRERRWFITGTLGATLAIASVYLVIAFIFIFVLTKVLH